MRVLRLVATFAPSFFLRRRADKQKSPLAEMSCKNPLSRRAIANIQDNKVTLLLCGEHVKGLVRYCLGENLTGQNFPSSAREKALHEFAALRPTAVSISQ
jgi:hypothetical protein